MRIGYILLFFQIFSEQSVIAQEKKDSFTYRYFIFQPKHAHSYGTPVQEGKTLIIKDFNGKHFKGRFFMLDDSTFRLQNTGTNKFDTLSLKSISKARRPTVGALLLSVYLELNGVMMMALGYEIASISPAGEDIEVMAAFALMASPYFILGEECMNGPSLNTRKFNFYLYSANGFKLKRKHLKYLFPKSTL